MKKVLSNKLIVTLLVMLIIMQAITMLVIFQFLHKNKTIETVKHICPTTAVQKIYIPIKNQETERPTPTLTPTPTPEPTLTPTPIPTEAPTSKMTSDEQKYNDIILEVCKFYPNVEPELVHSIIYHESRYNPKTTTGKCVGLMQVSTHWHADRATKLGVTDFYDPYSNILLGVDFISELMDDYKDPKLVLMLYNMKRSTAFKLYKEGKTSNYARSVLDRAAQLKGAD